MQVKFTPGEVEYTTHFPNVPIIATGHLEVTAPSGQVRKVPALLSNHLYVLVHNRMMDDQDGMLWEEMRVKKIYQAEEYIGYDFALRLVCGHDIRDLCQRHRNPRTYYLDTENPDKIYVCQGRGYFWEEGVGLILSDIWKVTHLSPKCFIEETAFDQVRRVFKDSVPDIGEAEGPYLLPAHYINQAREGRNEDLRAVLTEVLHSMSEEEIEELLGKTRQKRVKEAEEINAEVGSARLGSSLRNLEL